MANFLVDNFKIAAVDNNYKVVVDAGVAKLAPDADVFGEVYSEWTRLSGTEMWVAWPTLKTATISESAGLHHWNDNGSAIPWSGGSRRDVSYEDAEVVCYFSFLNYIGDKVRSNYLHLWRSQGNTVFVCYDHALRNAAAYSVIAGAANPLVISFIDAQADIWFRIKRDISGAQQTFQLWYAIVNPIAKYGGDPANWISLWGPAVITGATFDKTHLLYPLISVYTNSVGFNPDVDFYDQIAGAEERFWDDSPEFLISDDGAVDYALDAGAGATFSFTGFSAVVSEPGTSTVKFKIGYYDGGAPTEGNATWDGTWRSVAEMDTFLASGAVDGHRYYFLRAQMNSGGADRPTLTSVTFIGAIVEEIPKKWIEVAVEVENELNVEAALDPEIETEMEITNEYKVEVEVVS